MYFPFFLLFLLISLFCIVSFFSDGLYAKLFSPYQFLRRASWVILENLNNELEDKKKKHTGADLTGRRVGLVEFQQFFSKIENFKFSHSRQVYEYILYSSQ